MDRPWRDYRRQDDARIAAARAPGSGGHLSDERRGAAEPSGTSTLRLLICGRVQGVGFRYAFADEALSRKLRGWVRNRRDGCVEAIVSGPATDVDAIVAWSRRGPAAAQVTGIETAAAEGDFASFEVAPTV